MGYRPTYNWGGHPQVYIFPIKSQGATNRVCGEGSYGRIQVPDVFSAGPVGDTNRISKLHGSCSLQHSMQSFVRILIG